jgi:hypothetical protein
LVGRHPEDWLSAEVEIRCGVWNGRLTANFLSGELNSFGTEVRQLHDELSGCAKLEPVEPFVSLQLSGDGRGHITLDGVAQDPLFTGTRLAFRFELDQTQLPAIADALIKADPQ